MTTTKSYSDSGRAFAMYRSALKQLSSFAVISTIAFFLSIFLPSYTEISYLNKNDRDELARFLRNHIHGFYVAEEHGIIILILVAMLSLAVALAANRYMHSKKSIDVYHSLPVRRSVLFTVNLLAGATSVLVPFLLAAGATMLLQVATLGAARLNAGYWAAALLEIAAVVCHMLLVYCFTSFIAVNVGSVFDAFAISFAFGFSPPLIYAICGAIGSDLIYGLTFGGDHVLRLSPFLLVFERYRLMWDSGNSGSAISVLLACLGAALIFYFLGLMLYNRRKSEIAEITQTSGVFQTVVKCIAAFLGSAVFYAIFYGRSRPVQLVGMLIGAVVIGTIAELILSRGVRHIVKNLLWLAGTGIACCVLLLVVDMDLFGVERKVPDPQQVASVTVNYYGRFNELSPQVRYRDSDVTLTDPESIGIVTDMHRLAVENAPPSGGYYASNYNSGEYMYSYTTLSYTMKNGTVLKRSYSEVYAPAYAKLSDLEAQDNFIEQAHPIFLYEDLTVPQENLVRRLTLYATASSSVTSLSLTRENTALLLEALREDMRDETLEQIQYPATKALGYLEIEYIEPTVQNNPYRSYYSSAYVLIAPHHTRTLAILDRIGESDFLSAPLEGIERIYLRDYWYIDNGRVAVVAPDVSANYNYSDYLPFSTEDPQEMETLLLHAKSQLLISANRNNIRLVSCEREEEIVAAFLINISDLPSVLQEKINSDT